MEFTYLIQSMEFCVFIAVLGFFTVTKYLRKTTHRKKDLFWLAVSEVSAPGHLAALLWARGEAEHQVERP
jgi:hypothetical protein